MTPTHIEWLYDTGTSLQTNSGETVPVFELRHENNDEILSEWACHFRNQYCSDTQIDALRAGTGKTKAEYLKEIKFPDKSVKPGPSLRAGDFAEILAADYLEYVLNHWVPRTRYINKTIRNESTKGVDTIGFLFEKEGEASPNDKLTIIESKAKYTGRHNKSLQNAIEHSGKDVIRKAESLNAIKQRFVDLEADSEVARVQRFQDEADNPYRQEFGAIVHLDDQNYSDDIITEADTSAHPFSSNLFLIVIKGAGMMGLVHKLYEKASDEA